MAVYVGRTGSPHVCSPRRLHHTIQPLASPRGGDALHTYTRSEGAEPPTVGPGRGSKRPG